MSRYTAADEIVSEDNVVQESHAVSYLLWGRCAASQMYTGTPVSTQFPSRPCTSPRKLSRHVLVQLEVTVRRGIANPFVRLQRESQVVEPTDREGETVLPLPIGQIKIVFSV